MDWEVFWILLDLALYSKARDLKSLDFFHIFWVWLFEQETRQKYLRSSHWEGLFCFFTATSFYWSVAFSFKMVLFCVQQWLEILSWWYDLYDVTTLKTNVSAVDVDVLCLAFIAYIMLFRFMPV